MGLLMKVFGDGQSITNPVQLLIESAVSNFSPGCSHTRETGGIRRSTIGLKNKITLSLKICI